MDETVLLASELRQVKAVSILLYFCRPETPGRRDSGSLFNCLGLEILPSDSLRNEFYSINFVPLSRFHIDLLLTDPFHHSFLWYGSCSHFVILQVAVREKL